MSVHKVNISSTVTAMEIGLILMPTLSASIRQTGQDNARKQFEYNT